MREGEEMSGVMNGCTDGGAGGKGGPWDRRGGVNGTE